ncbi:tetratricopeptide repeat protein [Nonomuraea sp. SYSU D8015]|uniref:tetratricopeptide repeat protein n=1 Tax=Nonomuraea sp. SYSU D8015 TaxID=2593644 RepID=UPI0016605B55|nr:tetratricopeptide repeat protein [Nonomuraea sp. SYSU D8015]
MVKVDESIERARTLLRLRRPADAERELRGVLAVEPQQDMAHCLLAFALVHQGKAAEAMVAAREAVRLVPDHWYPHYVSGQVFLHLGLADPAITAANESLAQSTEHTSTWELLARAHLLKGQWREAADAARSGLAVDPQVPDLVSLLSIAHTKLGEAEPARAAAAHAIQLDPESATAHLAAGRAALAFGDPKAAADSFREVLRLDPGYSPARDLLVSALKQRNPLQRMLSKLRRRYLGGWRLVFLLPVAPPFIAVFILIALLHWAAWVSESVTVLRLTLAKATRLLFEGAEARVAMACCALLPAGIAVLALGIALGQEPVGTAGVAIMALITPVQEATHISSPRGRVVLRVWTGLLVAAIVAALIAGSTGGALLSVYAGLGTIWIAAGARRFFRDHHGAQV